MKSAPFLKKTLLYLRLRTRGIGYRFMPVPAPRHWVFIVGCYNSGTTLLHELLSRHPEIGSMPNEGQFFTAQLMTGAKAGVRRLWALKPELFRMTENDSNVDAERLKKEWAYFFNHPGRKILIEKTIANAARTRWLQRNFPGARFICLFRNGYAVAEGILRKEQHSLETAALQWKVSNDILLEDMEHLQNKLQIKYEELTDNPALTLRKVTDFLNLEPLPESVFSEIFSIHKLNSSIRNMNDEAVSRLTPDQISQMNAIAATTLQKLGYQLLTPEDGLLKTPD